ncbi:hypothetical protein ACTQ44_06760 [Ligilactobacillus ruminis]|uniref:hypothetical protein n=1 Tax=Ligilactobacillus ruminis TaxID=1623 RepID=UPI003F9B428D
MNTKNGVEKSSSTPFSIDPFLLNAPYRQSLKSDFDGKGHFLNFILTKMISEPATNHSFYITFSSIIYKNIPNLFKNVIK